MNHTETAILNALSAQVMTFAELQTVLRLPESDVHHAIDRLLAGGAIHFDPRTATESEPTKA